MSEYTVTDATDTMTQNVLGGMLNHHLSNWWSLNRTEPDAWYYVPDIDGYVGVHKLGGGTIGERYDGTWAVEILPNYGSDYDNAQTYEGIYVGMPKTHLEVLEFAIEQFLYNDED